MDREPGKSRILCFMPAYNAAGRMGGVVDSIPAEAWTMLDGLLVVDDGSTDGTPVKAREMASLHPSVSVVSHPRNRGYGAAQKTAFHHALDNGHDGVVMLHSDGQYPPALLPDMIRPLLNGADVVGGSRTLGGDMRRGGMSLPRYYGTIWLNALENLVFGARLTSYHSGYKAYSRRALELIPFDRYSDTFNFDSEMLAGAIRAKLPIVEVPIPTIHGKGYSSLKPIPYGLSVLGTILRYIAGRI